MSDQNSLFEETIDDEKVMAPAGVSRVDRLVRAAGLELVEREYRPLWHAAAVILILASAGLLFYGHFQGHGILMHADMTFPLTLNRIAGEVTNTWLEYGGFNVVQFVQNSPWILSFMLVAKVFGLSTAQYLLVMFITTFALAGVSMYALAYSTIKRIKPLDRSRYGLYAGAFLAAIIYMYNPFSLFNLWPFMMYVAYALMPLIFMLLRKTYREPKLRYIIVLALLVSLASTHPMGMTWAWIMIAAYTIYYLVVQRFGKQSLLTAAKVFFSSIVLYLLINAAWVVPYVGAKLAGKPLVPAYSPYLVQGSLNGLSQSATLSNNLRLVSGYGQFAIPRSNGAVNVILSFTLPALAILCLIMLGKRIEKNGTVIFMAAVSGISLLVATGASFILRRPYSYMVLRAPGSASVGWIFRSPNRLLFVVPIFYALMLGILVAWLMREAPRLRDRTREEVRRADG
jgi:hypothetical protein